MNYEVINNYAYPIVEERYVGATAEAELEVHVTSDDGIDITCTVCVTEEVTYFCSGDYENPDEIESESSVEVYHESEGRTPTAEELKEIYDTCERMAYD